MKLVLLFAFLFVASSLALVRRSSHSEAPGTAKIPNADITDLYAFKSYEAGKEDYVVFLMNSIPLQNPNAGPNYYTPSDNHFFEINIDNNGDCVEDLIIQWYNGNSLGGNLANITQVDDAPCSNGSLIEVEAHEGIKLAVGNPGSNDTRNVAVALKFVGSISQYNENDPNLNWREWYQMNLVRGNRETGSVEVITDADSGSPTFAKPFDYAGVKSFPDYAGYSVSDDFIHTVDIPGCTPSGGAYAARVFVGQRKESFSIALGKIFDLIDFVPVPPGTFASNPNAGVADCAEHNELAGKNVLTYAIEIHKDCILNATDVIGVWGTVRQLTHEGSEHIPGRQVSRLGNPLVNELVIGLNDKAKFTIGHPTGDGGSFLEYVQYPTLPVIINLLFREDIESLTGLTIPSLAPTVPRSDLVTAFLTGIPGLNQFPDFAACEYQRLNVTVPLTSPQDRYGVINGDFAGFPNGRRPGDDVVDIALRVMMGALCHQPDAPFGCNATDAPIGNVPLTDGSPQSSADFDNQFPFLKTPNPGSVSYSDATTCSGASSSGTIADGGDGNDGTCGSSASALVSWVSVLF